MLSPESVTLPRDCYTSYQVRRLFGRRDAADEKKVVPISRVTLKRWRQKGYIPFIKLNCRTFLYPREAVQRVLQETNTSLPAQA